MSTKKEVSKDVNIIVHNKDNPVFAEVTGLTPNGRTFVKEYYKNDNPVQKVSDLGIDNDVLKSIIKQNLTFRLKALE